MKRTVPGLILVAALLAGAGFLHFDVRSRMEEDYFPFRTFFLPDSDYMKFASLGYRSFYADLFYIWQILYYDYYPRDVRYEYLEQTFEVVTDLDPGHQEPYLLNMLFAFMGGKWDLLYAMADKGIDRNPDNHIIAYDAGIYALTAEKNHERAIHYFRIAQERAPDKPIYRLILAKAHSMGGNLRISMEYWRELYAAYEDDDSAEGNYYRGAALRNLWNTKIEIDREEIGEALEIHRLRFGRYPPNLEVLAAEGLLPAVPLDPAGIPYAYDPVAGEVSSGSPFDYKEAMGQW